MPKYNIDSILIKVIKAGVLACFFIPLLYNPSYFFPFIVFKEITFRIIIEVIFSAYLIVAIRNPEYRPRLYVPTMLVIFFLLWTIITSLVGVDVSRSIWGNYERMGGILRVGHLLLYFIVLSGVFRNKSDWNNLFTFSVLISVLMSFIGLAQYWNIPFILESSGGTRLTGTIGNAIYLAAYMLFNIAFICYYWCKEKEFNARLFFWGVVGIDFFLLFLDIYQRGHGADQTILTQLFASGNFLLAIVLFQIGAGLMFWQPHKAWLMKTLLSLLLVFELLVLMWTQTRGAILGLYAALVAMSLMGIFMLKLRTRRAAFAGLLAVLILVPLAIYSLRAQPWILRVPVLHRLATMSIGDITTQSRLLTWRASWQGWAEQPVRFFVGYGEENYSYVFDKYFPAPIFRDAGSQIWFDRAHNIIFDTAISSGLIGLVLYLAIFGFIFMALLRYYRSTQDFYGPAILGSLLVAYLVQNLFVFDTLDSLIMFFAVIGFVLFLNQGIKAEHRWSEHLKSWFERRHQKNGPQPVVIGLIAFTLVSSIYFFNIQTARANRALYQTLVASMQRPFEIDTNIKNFSAAIAVSRTGRIEARQQYFNYVLTLLSANGFPIERTLAVAESVEKELKANIDDEPANMRHHLFLANFYNRFAQYRARYADKVFEIFTPEVIALSPTRPQIYFEIGQAHLIKGQKDEALTALLRARDIAPIAKDTHTALAIAYSLHDEFDLALAEIEFIYKVMKTDFPQLNELEAIANVMAAKNRFDVRANLYRLVVQHNSEPGYFIRAAEAFAAVDDRAAAESAMQKALELDPNLADHSAQFLTQLREGKLKK